jgi:hypothetical protein
MFRVRAGWGRLRSHIWWSLQGFGASIFCFVFVISHEVLPAMAAMRVQLEVEVDWGTHGAACKKQVSNIVDKRWLRHVSDCPVYEAGYALNPCYIDRVMDHHMDALDSVIELLVDNIDNQVAAQLSLIDFKARQGDLGVRQQKRRAYCPASQVVGDVRVCTPGAAARCYAAACTVH